MSQYGKVLGIYDPEMENMYNTFTNYFNNPELTKTKDENGLSMYMGKLYCLLSNECRYIVVLCASDLNAIGAKVKLQDIEWMSLQTRTLPKKNDLYPVSYTAPRDTPFLTTIINRVNVTDEASTYHCNSYPVVVTMLHTKKNTKDDYKATGTISAALETFQTIITLQK